MRQMFILWLKKWRRPWRSPQFAMVAGPGPTLWAGDLRLPTGQAPSLRARPGGGLAARKRVATFLSLA